MPPFRYQAFDNKGNVIAGEKEAASVTEVKDILRAENLIVFRIDRVDRDASFWGIIKSFFEPAITDKVKIQFTNQLGILLKSGVPLLDAMELLSLQFDGSFKKVLLKIIENLKEGISLADTIEKYPKIFSNVYVQLVRAGEASGKLELVLDRMTSFLERSIQIDNSISKALRGPMFTGGLITVVFLAATMFVLPMMGKTLGQIGRELPFLTQMMLDLSEFLRSKSAIFLAISIVVAWVLFSRWRSTEAGRIKYHAMLLRVPKVSTLTKSRAVVQFAQTLGMLLDAGVNLPLALDIVNNVIENAVLVNTLKKARDEIIKEGKITKHLKNTEMFPPVSIYMIRTGEEAGKLAEMLIRVGNDAEIELVESVDSVVSSIDPIMMVVTGVVAMVLILSIFLPIMQMSDIQGSM